MVEEKKQEKAKTQSREFTVSFRKCKMKGKPDIEKAKHAIALLKKFFKKHYRKAEKEILISNEVNEEVWKKSNNIKNKIQVLAVEKEGKLKVYLKDSKELKAEEDGKKAKEKKAAEEKTKAAAKKEETGKETSAEKAEIKPPAEKSPPAKAIVENKEKDGVKKQ